MCSVLSGVFQTVSAILIKNTGLKCPSNSESMYCNYEQYHSTVFWRLLMFDTDLLPSTLVLMASSPMVGGISRTNWFCWLLNDSNSSIPVDKELPLSDVKLPFVILGDEAYELLKIPYEAITRTASYRIEKNF